MDCNCLPKRENVKIGVEGIDGSGKTTFINHLQEEVYEGAPVMHCFSKNFKPPWTTKKELLAGIDRVIQATRIWWASKTNDVVLLDRTFISGMVYSRYFSNAYPWFDYLQRKFAAPETLYFIDIDCVTASERRDEYDIETLRELNYRYKQQINKYYDMVSKITVNNQPVIVFRYKD